MTSPHSSLPLDMWSLIIQYLNFTTEPFTLKHQEPNQGPARSRSYASFFRHPLRFVSHDICRMVTPQLCFNRDGVDKKFLSRLCSRGAAKKLGNRFQHRFQPQDDSISPESLYEIIKEVLVPSTDTQHFIGATTGTNSPPFCRHSLGESTPSQSESEKLSSQTLLLVGQPHYVTIANISVLFDCLLLYPEKYSAVPLWLMRDMIYATEFQLINKDGEDNNPIRDLPLADMPTTAGESTVFFSHPHLSITLLNKLFEHACHFDHLSFVQFIKSYFPFLFHYESCSKGIEEACCTDAIDVVQFLYNLLARYQPEPETRSKHTLDWMNSCVWNNSEAVFIFLLREVSPFLKQQNLAPFLAVCSFGTDRMMREFLIFFRECVDTEVDWIESMGDVLFQGVKRAIDNENVAAVKQLLRFCSSLEEETNLCDKLNAPSLLNYNALILMVFSIHCSSELREIVICHAIESKDKHFIPSNEVVESAYSLGYFQLHERLQERVKCLCGGGI